MAGTSPYNIEETQPILSTYTAAYAVDRYGARLGGKVRLLLHSEAVSLESTNSDILYGVNGKSLSAYLNYWLGSAYSAGYMSLVMGDESNTVKGRGVWNGNYNSSKKWSSSSCRNIKE